MAGHLLIDVTALYFWQFLTVGLFTLTSLDFHSVYLYKASLSIRLRLAIAVELVQVNLDRVATLFEANSLQNICR
jgi:hypothetical protein